MNRRDFLRSTGAFSASLAFAKAGRLFARGITGDQWRTFEVTTSVEVLKPSGATRIWLPTALFTESPFQKRSPARFNPKAAQRRWTKARRIRLESSSRNFRLVSGRSSPSRAGSLRRPIPLISARPAMLPKKPPRIWHIFCGRPSYCQPMAL